LFFVVDIWEIDLVFKVILMMLLIEMVVPIVSRSDISLGKG